MFDLNQCYGQMRQWVLMAQSAAAQTQSRGIGGATSSFNDMPDNLNPSECILFIVQLLIEGIPSGIKNAYAPWILFSMICLIIFTVFIQIGGISCLSCENSTFKAEATKVTNV